MLKGLTQTAPLTPAAPAASSQDGPIQVADLEVVQELFQHNHWTDGLPIVVPTQERVRAMMSAINRQPHEVVAFLAPQGGPATVEKLAVNAVMAGCRPDYFPLILTAVEALADPDFDLRGHTTCGSSATPLFIVNGPVRKALYLSSSYGAFASLNPANATISRALRLIRLNIGGQVPGLTSMSTFGFPGGGIGLSVAEDEENNPWEPLHIQRGFRREDSTVTVASVLTFQNVCHQHTEDPDSLLSLIAFGAANMAYRSLDQGPINVGYVLVVLSPGHAQRLADAGYALNDVQIALRDRARLSLDEFPREVIPKLQEGGRVDGKWAYSVASPEQVVIFVAGGYRGSAIGSEPAIVMHGNHQDWKIVTKKIPV